MSCSFHTYPVSFTRLMLIGAIATVMARPGFSQDCLPQFGESSSDTTVTPSSDSTWVQSAPPSRVQWHSMITRLPGDWMRGINQVFQVDNLPAIAGLTAITIGLVASDKRTYRPSGSLYQSSPPIHGATDFFVSLGDTRSHMILAGGFAAYGLLESDQRSLVTASQTIEAVLAAGIVVQVLKRISGRESPEVATEPSGKWTPFPNMKEYHRHQSSFYAFPSGHIATSMAVVTVVAENYPEASWIRPVGYTVVGLMGVSLVNRGFHWYSDLPLGIALGHMFGKIAAHPDGSGATSAEHAPGSIRVTLTPMVGPYGSGFQASMEF